MKKNFFDFLKQHFFILIFLSFYFIITAYKFISTPTPFYDWDESIYAQVGREMIKEKSLVPLWQNNYWLDKPPLVPLAYGIVEKFSPGSAELSTRIFTLSLAICVLALIYILYYRLTKSRIIAISTVIITSFTSIFLQRTQVLNVDVFLYLGWLGYIVFYSNFWISLLFLAIGVLSKSLLGFYPVIIFSCLYTFQLLIKQLKPKRYKQLLTYLIIQSSVLLLWYIVMLAIFKMPFIKAHFLDSMIKRVTSSIESHFGKRTFYIDLLFNQLGVFALLSVIGIIFIYKDFFRKKDFLSTTLSIFFVPWFLFLNLTKTKIDWYLYPVIAQFVFLGIYLLQIIKKYRLLILLVFLAITSIVFKNNLFNNSFLSTHYSSYDENYRLAIYAKNVCRNINVLVDKDSRQTHDTLKKMNLLIGTSEWWGNHPSIVYYSDKKVNFVYEVAQFDTMLIKPSPDECFVISKSDLPLFLQIKSIKLNKQFNDQYLFKTN
jgi:hypothetical protein